MSSQSDYHRGLHHRRSSLLARSIALACIFAMPGAYAQSSEDPASTDGSDKKISKVTLGTVQVTADGSQVEIPPAYAGGQVASGGRVGLFGNLDMMETPFNSTNYTAELMRNQQARSVADVVQNDPAVRVSRGFGNFQELYVMRGFPVYSDDMGYNGLYGLLPRQYVAAEFLERVEVFRGANSFLNGAAPGGSGLGGSINLVPKRAGDEPLNRVTLGYENEGQGYGGVDLSRRFGANKEFGVRANGVHRDGKTSVDLEKRKLGVLSVGVDYRGSKGRMSADMGWQDHRIDAPRPSVTPTDGIPKAPEASSNYAQEWTFSGERDLFGVARGEYDLNEDTTVWAATGVRDSTEHNVLSNPNSDVTGALTQYRFDNYREDRVSTSDAGIRAKFSTGSISHRVSASGSIFSLKSKNAYGFSNFAGFANDLYNPTQSAAPPATFFQGGDLRAPLMTSQIKTNSFAVADTIGFLEDHVMVTLGARRQVIEQYSYDYNTGIQFSGYNESAITPVVGVVIRPSQKYSIYANYIEGLTPGETAPAVSGGVPITNVGEVFKPYRSKQYELGAKYDGGSFGMSAAVYQASRPSGIREGTYYRPHGEQVNRGLELSMFGEPVTGFRVLGGLTFSDAEMKKTGNPAMDGKDAIGIPGTQANMGMEWDIPGVPGLVFDSRFVYTSAQWANASNTWKVKSWNRLDIGARHTIPWGEKSLVLRARLDNVADRASWVAVGGGSSDNYLVMSSPRTFVLSASLEF